MISAAFVEVKGGEPPFGGSRLKGATDPFRVAPFFRRRQIPRPDLFGAPRLGESGDRFDQPSLGANRAAIDSGRERAADERHDVRNLVHGLESLQQ